jgi:hypothetical protein
MNANEKQQFTVRAFALKIAQFIYRYKTNKTVPSFKFRKLAWTYVACERSARAGAYTCVSSFLNANMQIYLQGQASVRKYF